MYAAIDYPTVTSVSGLLEPVPFFEALPVLLSPNGYTVGLGCNMVARPTQIVRFAKTVKSAELFCDHVIAFQTEAFLSFHDAFKGPAMLVSPVVPSDRIRAFCELLGAESDTIPNPQWQYIESLGLDPKKHKL